MYDPSQQRNFSCGRGGVDYKFQHPLTPIYWQQSQVSSIRRQLLCHYYMKHRKNIDISAINVESTVSMLGSGIPQEVLPEGSQGLL
jgi:hypothetical protein